MCVFSVFNLKDCGKTVNENRKKRRGKKNTRDRKHRIPLADEYLRISLAFVDIHLHFVALPFFDHEISASKGKLIYR